MTTLFMEPGGDATFETVQSLGASQWAGGVGVITGTVSVVTDFVSGGHVKSLQIPASGAINNFRFPIATQQGRITYYARFVALPGTTATTLLLASNNSFQAAARLKITSAGVLQLFEFANQLGSNGSTLAVNTWYRITMCWFITSTTVNEFRVYVNNVLDITASNVTVTGVTVSRMTVGNRGEDGTIDIRMSDIYCDDSSSANDIASDVRVTAKRPNANGTTNGFTTQIGSGGSGYGSGRSPQVNERPISTTNGWQMVGAGSAVTEEYSVEGAAVGDIDISAATIIDYAGWVWINSAVSESGTVIVGGTNTAKTFNSQMFLAVPKGSTTYPAGGTDIGIITDTTLTTVSLYECGLLFAYTPGVAGSLLPALKARQATKRAAYY